MPTHSDENRRAQLIEGRGTPCAACGLRNRRSNGLNPRGLPPSMESSKELLAEELSEASELVARLEGRDDV